MSAGVRNLSSTVRKRRRAILAAVGVVAAGTAALVVPNAFAEGLDLGLGEAVEGAVEALPVDDSLLGIIEIGEVVEVAESLTYADVAGGDGTQLEFHQPDAGYVKLHFERLLLSGGDFATVSSPDGAESHRIEESTVGDWATSITGDTAILRLHPQSGSPASAALGALVDQVAYGFPDETIDSLVDEYADEARPEESLCNTDDKKPAPCYAASYPTVVKNTAPVARLLIDGTVLCTAFRVGENNRMLTNNHCFSESWEAQRSEVWFGYDCTSCRGHGTTDPVKVRGERVHATDRNYDFTLFSVDDFAAIESFGWLSLATERPARGTAIYIPQHPAGRATEIALKSSVDNGNCVVSTATMSGYVEGTDVGYYCDTEFGSSGSPVLSRDTHQVVALHHFGGCPNSGVSAHLIEQKIRSLI